MVADLRDGRVRRGHRLDLRGGQLELEALVARETIEDLGRLRRQVEIGGREQHQLLLDAEGQFVGPVEGAGDLGSARHHRFI